MAWRMLGERGGMRMLGWLLLLYAMLGAGLVIASLAIGGPLVARVDRLATSASGSMDAAARARRGTPID
jgi:hypothetical protein